MRENMPHTAPRARAASSTPIRYAHGRQYTVCPLPERPEETAPRHTRLHILVISSRLARRTTVPPRTAHTNENQGSNKNPQTKNKTNPLKIKKNGTKAVLLTFAKKQKKTSKQKPHKMKVLTQGGRVQNSGQSRAAELHHPSTGLRGPPRQSFPKPQMCCCV